MKKTEVAVIGAGYWGKKVVREYVRLSEETPDLHLFGACDLSRTNLQYCRENLGVTHLTTDHRELLAWPGVDAVHICTPNETHYEICRDALQSGKHVMVEKPMTLNAIEAYTLIETAKEKNLVLSVGHIFRFNNALNKVRVLIRDGFFGQIFHLRLQWTTWTPPIQGRDIISDLAPHPLDILNLLLNRWPEKVTCRAKTHRRDRLEEVAYIIVDFDNGVSAHIELSWLLPSKTREVSIIGSSRSAKVDCLSQHVDVFEEDRSYALDVKPNNTLEAELLHFKETIQNNSLSKSFTIKNSGIIGAQVVGLIEIAKRSLREERTVRADSLYGKTPVSSLYSILRDVSVGEDTKVHDQVNLYGCRIGRNCKIDAYVYIEEDVTIGDNCKIRPFSFIPTGVVLEDDVFIGPNVTFTNDKYPRSKGSWRLLPTRVKSGASIGANSVILPGVTIGENALVGAGSVVTKDVPDNAVVAGNPARIIRYRAALIRPVNLVPSMP